MNKLPFISFRPVDVGFDLRMTRTPIQASSIPVRAHVQFLDHAGEPIEFVGDQVQILDRLQDAGYVIAGSGAKIGARRGR